uniref:LIM zinc-binding domain-containing protein n=1 Tax=Sinocyclocheilus grahami TaxID=75366 RepID=A0A672QNM6_SINGR
STNYNRIVIQTSIHSIRVPKSEMCAVCKKRVYPMEGLIADKKKFHKSCFFCEHCNNKLSLGNFVSLHGHLYCHPHYKQLFKSKGNFEDGFEQGLQRELLAYFHDSEHFLIVFLIKLKKIEI